MARAIELVVVHHRDTARIAVRVVRDVPHEFRVCRIVNVEDRRTVPLLLSGYRIHLGLAVPEALVVTHVHPAAIGGIGERGHDQRLSPLQIVVADQAHVARIVRARIGVPARGFDHGASVAGRIAANKAGAHNDDDRRSQQASHFASGILLIQSTRRARATAALPSGEITSI